MVDQPKFQRHIVLIVTRGGGRVTIIKNEISQMKIVLIGPRRERGKLSWDNVLKSATCCFYFIPMVYVWVRGRSDDGLKVR